MLVAEFDSRRIPREYVTRLGLVIVKPMTIVCFKFNYQFDKRIPSIYL